MSTAGTRPVRIDAQGWGWRHAGRAAWAVAGLELRIEPGERVLLLGASGSGKSTLLHGLAGVLGGDEEGEAAGALLVDGAPAASARGRAGLVLQDPDSQVILARVGDDVAFGCENLGVPREQIWPRVHDALGAVGLDVALDRPTKALSGGQKQRLALAGAVAMRPGLLLLDEPTANLDPQGVGEVVRAVERVLHATGATLVVVEHRVEAWLPLVDRVIVLGAGEGGTTVMADGSPEAVLRGMGAALSAAGVWVPGFGPSHPSPPPATGGETLLDAADLAISRVHRPRRMSDAAFAPNVVAREIALEVRAGSVLAVTGPNGAGKSTLGLTIAGLLAPVAGRVHAAPTLAGGLGPDPMRWRSRELLTRIGTVFQDPEHQLLAATVRGELEVGPRALGLGQAEMDARIEPLLERLRLDRLARANPYTLSGGEKRRLTVAAALATAPRMLVLDEPTFGQDARTWAELVALLAELRDEGTGIAVVTHDDEVVRALHATRHALEVQR
ncbi:MAG TPA: ATP-binding cassette domain-containing protein [Microbacteriaceae bacterium]|nr:ATP-binding cassette domain-containing protein [Microbacteriaceae bacterium]HPZ33589.1 ATP-binding cassette domain-containing protein [Microbacteriaceae bacterium]HQC93469.1 ATP-binding cassette domain-containing protein [Microbacteriaceae bacterium]